MTEPPDDTQNDKKPDALRVLRRGRVLYALASRAMFETHADKGFAATCRENLLQWINDNDLLPECEPFEEQILRADIGSLDTRQIMYNSWNYECAAVLAWALGRFEMPPLDQQASDVAVGNVFMNADLADEGLCLRPLEVIQEYEGLMYNLHWRARDFILSQRPYNMSRMLADATEIPGIASLCFLEDDIAIGDAPLFKARTEEAQKFASVVHSRRHAASWLCGEAEVFSEVPLDT